MNADSSSSDNKWLSAFWNDFRRRVVNLLGFDFRKFSPTMALSILSNKNLAANRLNLDHAELAHIVSPYDLRRLELYSSNMADYHLVTDLMPSLAR